MSLWSVSENNSNNDDDDDDNDDDDDEFDNSYSNDSFSC